MQEIGAGLDLWEGGRVEEGPTLMEIVGFLCSEGRREVRSSVAPRRGWLGSMGARSGTSEQLRRGPEMGEENQEGRIARGMGEGEV